MPGSIFRQPYSVRGNLARARRLAPGHFRNGRVRVAYQSAGTIGPLDAQLLRQELIALGFDQSRIDMVGYAGFDIYTAAGTPGAPFDLILGVGYCDDTGDSASTLDTFIDPGRWRQSENNYGGIRRRQPVLPGEVGVDLAPPRGCWRTEGGREA
jgi:hypothetical protein